MPNSILAGFVSILGLIFVSSMMAVPAFSSPSPQLLEMKIKMVEASQNRKLSAVNSESSEQETSTLKRVHDALESAKIYLNEGKLEKADQQLSQNSVRHIPSPPLSRPNHYGLAAVFFFE